MDATWRITGLEAAEACGCERPAACRRGGFTGRWHGIRRAAAALLTAVLALSLASCGGDTGAASTAAAEDGETVEETVPLPGKEPEAADPAENVQEPAETAEEPEEPPEGEAETAEEPEEPPEGEAPEAAPGNDTAAEPLVLYFSRVGNTDFPADVDAASSASIIRDGAGIAGNAQRIAEWIADEAGAALMEIQTKASYPIDYRETTEAALQEQKDNARPVLSMALLQSAVERAGDVYLVFPNWWDSLPMPLFSFFDAYDFSGKTLNVFITHGGSSFSETLSTIRDLEPKASVVQGASIAAEAVPDSEEAVRQWVRDNG